MTTEKRRILNLFWKEMGGRSMTTGKKIKPVCERCQSTDEDGQVPAGRPVGEAYVVWDIEQQRLVLDDDAGYPLHKWYCPICECEVEVEWVDA